MGESASMREPGELGPVNTMRTVIAGGHFFAGQGALSALYLPYTAAPAHPCARGILYVLYISESATRSWGKMAPTLRVGAQMRPYGVAYRDVGQGREPGAVSFARRLFGTTKPHSARLVWPHLSANAGRSHSVNRP